MAVDEEAPEGGAEKEKDKAAGGGTSMLVKILIGIAVVAAVVTVTVFVSWKVSSDTRNPVAGTQGAAPAQHETRDKPLKTVEVGEITTVIRGSALKLTIHVAYDPLAEQNKGLDLELVDRLPQLRSMYLAKLFEMSDAELSPANINTLKTTLLDETNKLLRDGQIAAVYIPAYVFMGH